MTAPNLNSRPSASGSVEGRACSRWTVAPLLVIGARLRLLRSGRLTRYTVSHANLPILVRH